MQQVFNNLRAILTRHKENLPVVTVAEMLAEIDEEEAKRESEVCEWKYRSPASYAEAHKRWELISDVRDWNFCPYCGKRIKISEVE